MGALSFRTRILLIVFLFAVLPLGLLGLWITGETSRSGERLLRSRLRESLDENVSQIVSRWYGLRSDILFLTELPEVFVALHDESANVAPPAFIRIFEALDGSVMAAAVADPAGVEQWSVSRPETRTDVMTAGFEPTLPVSFDIRDKLSGRLEGSLTVEILAAGFLPSRGVVPAVAGTVLGLFEAGTDLPLLPIPLEHLLLSGREFTYGGDLWLADERILEQPPLRIVVAAPMSPFVQPFQAAARRGAGLVLLVTLAGLVLAALLTSRLTRSLRALSTAAEAVSAGELGRRVEVHGRDEVGRVADAFNTMTENLDRTMRELANRESLAAVGQFAAALAHEVRNPLTAIRVDLQIAEDELPEGSAGREAQERALREVMRLNETVSDTLRLARSGPFGSSPIDLSQPVQAAAAAAGPVFDQHSGHLDVDLGPTPLLVPGDAGALEQVFLNLLQNAAQALEPGGRVSLTVSTGGEGVAVFIRDDGAGMTSEIQDQIFEPLFSTRPEGTGLGLTIARRIVAAHGGDITLESSPGTGTLVRVWLPLEAGGTDMGRPAGSGSPM